MPVHAERRAPPAADRTATGRGPMRGDEAEAVARRSAIVPAGIDLAALVLDAPERPGRPLPDDVRTDMERRLGADLADVRIHTDDDAAAGAAALHAEAFTVGVDISFARGAFDPHGSVGRLRLAHELGHVLQQRSGHGAAMDWAVSRPDDPLERGAEASARQALALPPEVHVAPVAPPPMPSAAPSRLIQRRAVADAPPSPGVADPAGPAPRAPSASAAASPWLGLSFPGLLTFGPDGPAVRPGGGETAAATATTQPSTAQPPLDPDATPLPSAPVACAVTPPVPSPRGDATAAACRTDERARSQTVTAAREDAARNPLPPPRPRAGQAEAAGPETSGAKPVPGPRPVAGASRDGRVTVALPLPDLAEEIAPEFAVVVDADREGQLALQDAVARSLLDLGRSFDLETRRVDEGLSVSEAAISAAVTAARGLVHGGAGSTRAAVVRARAEQGNRVSLQLDRKRSAVPPDVAGIADAAQRAANDQADAAQRSGDAATGDLDRARSRYVATADHAGDEGAARASSYDEEPEIRSASVDAQRRAAHEVATQTGRAIDDAVAAGARDLRSGGPQVHTAIADQVRPVIQQIRDQAAPMQLAMTTAQTQVETALDGGVKQGSTSLEAASRALLNALASIDRQSKYHLREAAETTKAGLRQAQSTGEQELRTQARRFVDDAHAELAQHLRQVSSRPVRRQLARLLAAELRTVLHSGYGMGVGQSNRIAGQIAGQLSEAMGRFHSEVESATQPAVAGAEHTGHAGGQQFSQLQRQVITFLSTTASTALAHVDTAQTDRIVHLSGMTDFVRQRLQPAVDRTATRVNEDKNRLMSDASAKLGTLDQRIATASQKAREKAELGAFGAWLLDQVRSLGYAMLTPSFWVGLLVGLLVTIFIIATFGSGAVVLIIAGAVAGALAAGASYLTQVYVDPLVDPSAPRREFSASELGQQMLIGGIFGAVGAGVGAGVASGLGASVVGATARTLLIDRVAQVTVGAALGIVQNCLTNQEGKVDWHWHGENWDNGLLTNVVVSTAMTSHAVKSRIGALTQGARAGMVERGLAYNATPTEHAAAQQRMFARAGIEEPTGVRTSQPVPRGAVRAESGPVPERNVFEGLSAAEVDRALAPLDRASAPSGDRSAPPAAIDARPAAVTPPPAPPTDAHVAGPPSDAHVAAPPSDAHVAGPPSDAHVAAPPTSDAAVPSRPAGADRAPAVPPDTPWPMASPTGEPLRLSYPTEGGAFRYEAGPQPETNPFHNLTDAEINAGLAGLNEHAAPHERAVPGRLQQGDIAPYEPNMPHHRAAAAAGTPFRNPLGPPGEFAFGAPGAPPGGPFHGAMGRPGVTPEGVPTYHPAEVFGVLPADHPSYAVRVGPPGSYVDHVFNTLAEARAYAQTLASSGEANIRAASALPEAWPGGSPGNPVDAVRVFEIQPPTVPQPGGGEAALARPILRSGVAPQPESAAGRAGAVYPGSGPQVQLPIGTVRAGTSPILEIPITDRIPPSGGGGHLPTGPPPPPTAGGHDTAAPASGVRAVTPPALDGVQPASGHGPSAVAAGDTVATMPGASALPLDVTPIGRGRDYPTSAATRRLQEILGREPGSSGSAPAATRLPEAAAAAGLEANPRIAIGEQPVELAQTGTGTTRRSLGEGAAPVERPVASVSRGGGRTSGTGLPTGPGGLTTTPTPDGSTRSGPRLTRAEQAMRVVRSGGSETAAHSRVNQIESALNSALSEHAAAQQNHESAAGLLAETTTDPSYTAADRHEAAQWERSARQRLTEAAGSVEALQNEATAARSAQTRIEGFSEQRRLLSLRRDAELQRTGNMIDQPIRNVQAELGRVEGRLHNEVVNLDLALRRQAEQATPGVAGRPLAADNVLQLDPALHPDAHGVPIDVTTGEPMTAAALATWEPDHIMPRSEIARDARFGRLTPAQRWEILLDIPENYLPLSKSANGSKSGRTVNEWIANRNGTQRPAPALVEPLRAADVRARAAIEAAFQRMLGE